MSEKFALIKSIRADDAAKGKKATHYFDNNASIVSYKTGFPTLDYKLGYKVNVYDELGNFKESYPSLGITAGSYCLFIGKPGTSKTATAVKIAANIIRPFKNGFILHYDFEQALNYSRIQALTKLRMEDIKEGQYILRQERLTLDDLKSSIIELYRKKVEGGDKYKYHTGLKNEFGEEIVIYEPTVIIIDSIAAITIGSDDDSEAKTLEKMEEISSQTDRMRLTAEIGRFFNEIMGILREANIILLAINQIKVNPQVSIVKKQADILGLGQDETCPGGRAPLFLAHILIKFIAIGGEKYTEEEDGFSGFGVRAEIIKSRVSAALKYVDLIYNKNIGVDMVRSTVESCKDLGLVTGNRNGYYFVGHNDEKFTLVNMERDFRQNPNLYKYMKEAIIPILEKDLSGIDPADLDIPDAELNFYDL